MKRKSVKPLKILPILCLLSGCAVAPAIPALSGLFPAPAGSQVLTATSVKLIKQNYKIIKANAIGSSEGFSFLGLFTFKSPTYNEAMTQLYRSAGISEGKASALINVVHEHSSTYYILFALPKITVRADVIEFTDGAAPTKATEAERVH